MVSKLFSTLLLTATVGMNSLAFAAKNGEKAPDFTLKGHDGKTYKLSEMKGKTVVLEWYNRECPYVAKHYNAKNMQNLQKSFTDKGALWFSIASSKAGAQGHLDEKTAPTTMKEIGSNATAMLLDADGKVGKLYGAKTTPHMYVIDKNGILQYQGAIDDKPSSSPDSLKGAKPYLADAATAVLDGKAAPVATSKAYGCSIKY